MIKAYFTRILFGTLLSIYFINTYSQEKVKSYGVSAGGHIFKVDDGNFSPQIYKGTQVMFSALFATEAPKYIDITIFSFQKGKIHSGTTQTGQLATAKLTNGIIDWAHLRKMNVLGSSKNVYYVGGIFNSSFTYYKRNYDFDDSYYVFQSSISPAIHYRHPFNLKNKNFCFDSQIAIALLAYAVYPAYGSFRPDNLLNEDLNEIKFFDYVTGGKILTINKFQRINWMSGMTIKPNNKYAFRLNYNWEFINIKRTDNLIKANHSIYLSFIKII